MRPLRTGPARRAGTFHVVRPIKPYTKLPGHRRKPVATSSGGADPRPRSLLHDRPASAEERPLDPWTELLDTPSLKLFAVCLCKLSIRFRWVFRRLRLWPAISRFPTVETGVGGDSVRMLAHCQGRGSNSCCRDH